MSNIRRSSIVGFHSIKNKVSRNAFDLSHRHMFTAQIGELLPVFVQWVNPNETFKLGYNGFTRTQPLQTAAFTRLHENVQYYFVPFQSLWKYFEMQVNNMTTGQSGENISRIAKNISEDSTITTGMPYLNYSWFGILLDNMLSACCNSIYNAFKVGHKDYASISSHLDASVFRYGRLNYASTCKLLRALGMLNTDLDSYDMIANFLSYASEVGESKVSVSGFQTSKYGYGVQGIINKITNSPNISIFPLLAYHKIINDHYIYRQWQPYRSYVCNIDYLTPSDSMDFSAKLNSGNLSDLPLFRIAQSNLPLDYFNGILPKAQYGEESAASVDLSTSIVGSVRGATGSPVYGSSSAPSVVTPSHDGTLSSFDGKVSVGQQKTSIRTEHTHDFTASINVSSSSSNGSLKISALRSAIALQKYKEIQESNDSDFASQVLAHFGVKPKYDDYKSYFIGGGDSIIDINPQVNQNLVGDNTADIKATGAGQLSCGCKFTSRTYGIIIGIYRCVPQLDLARVGLDRNNFKTDASDFPIPELDRLGMQTQYRCEVSSPLVGRKNMSSYNGDVVDHIDMSATYGYLPRYAELKTSYDRYEGAFLSSLSSWVTGYTQRALNDFIVPKPTENTHFLDIDDLLVCDPRITNSIFVDQSAACVDNDKLLIGSVNSCVAIRPFSVYGLPYSN